jgi:acetylornithine aminotransferase/acetylornithine/N-succinyldiaminopimelate aminotransferase
MEDLMVSDKKFIMGTYKRYPLAVKRAKGKYIWSEEGKKYLDFFSGLAVNNLGHCHPQILKAIRNQLLKHLHISNLYYDSLQVKLAEKLVKLSIPGKVFFSNSGAEANECAIKLARKYSHLRGKKQEAKYKIIVFENSFHGRTLATLSATMQKEFQKGFTPLLSGFKQAKFNELSTVENAISSETCAIMVEPIQGEGGVQVATREFVRGLRTLCNKFNLILIFDEIQSGMGRTGKMFAYQHYGVTPDILTMAKGVGGGLPLGVTIAKDEIANLFGYGNHGSTFGGNPVSIAAGLAAVKLLDDELLQNVKVTGSYLMGRLNELKCKYPKRIKEVRGLGLIVGLELKEEGEEIVNRCFEQRILINCTHKKVLRFLPPLIINNSDIGKLVSTLDRILSS